MNFTLKILLLNLLVISALNFSDAILPVEKQGVCPASGSCRFPIHIGKRLVCTSITPDNCTNDVECPGSEKCCTQNMCRGRTCKQPVKKGNCPEDNMLLFCPKPADTNEVSSAAGCVNDFDCDGNMKCCNACPMRQCTQPTGVCPPQTEACTKEIQCSPDKRCDLCFTCCQSSCGGSFCA